MAFLTYRGRHMRGVTVLDVFFPHSGAVEVPEEIAAVLAGDPDFEAPAPESNEQFDAPDAVDVDPEEG